MSEEPHELLKSAYGVYTFYNDWIKTGCVKEIDLELKTIDELKEMFPNEYNFIRGQLEEGFLDELLDDEVLER